MRQISESVDQQLGVNGHSQSTSANESCMLKLSMRLSVEVIVENDGHHGDESDHDHVARRQVSRGLFEVPELLVVPFGVDIGSKTLEVLLVDFGLAVQGQADKDEDGDQNS